MEQMDYSTSPRRWKSWLSPFVMRFFRPIRFFWQRLHEGLYGVEIQGLEHLRAAVARGDGVLIISNHAANADPFVFLKASDQLGLPFYYMTAWQIFAYENWLNRRILRRHGCFSVNREGDDLRAVRQAITILQDRPNPLVIFPEGELYHTNDRLHSFRAGAATIALTAARRAGRRIVCVPAALRYHYVSDPIPHLTHLMAQLERRMNWLAPQGLNLPQRVYRFAESLIAAREREFLGEPRSGPLSPRLAALTETLLRRLEISQGIQHPAESFTDRVMNVRRSLLSDLEGFPEPDPRHQEAREKMATLRLATQFYSYAPDYEDGCLTVERLAEIMDKFEEDVLDVFKVTVRGKRRALISFGPPFEIKAGGKEKGEVAALTRVMEEAVRTQLAGLIPPSAGHRSHLEGEAAFRPEPALAERSWR